MKKTDKTPDASDKKLKRAKYEKELRRLQGELCHLQEWVRHKGLRVVIVFEGRDAAGKGGTIRALTERVSPREGMKFVRRRSCNNSGSIAGWTETRSPLELLVC